jgi:hypothetical protein
LRAAQHFHLPMSNSGFDFSTTCSMIDVVMDDRHRLRGAEVEVDVAQATDVEAREDPARGGLGVEAGDLARQGQDVAAVGWMARSWSPETAATDSGTFCRFSERRSAVTTTWSSAVEAGVVGEATCWAWAAPARQSRRPRSAAGRACWCG